MNRRDLSGIALLTLSVLGCAQVQQPGPTADKEGMPRYGGTTNLWVRLDPYEWDITYRGTTFPNDFGIALAYNSLLDVEAGPNTKYTDLVLRPELAERWEVSPDAKTFTFHLRKRVKFANIPPVEARELTSRDVKWSVDYFTRSGELKDKKLPTAQFGYFFDGMESLQTPDPYTAVFTFSEPNAPFINYAASAAVPVLAREIYERDTHYKEAIAGSGPYQLDMAASQKGSRWVWKKNPTYWDPGKPYIDEIRWLVLPDDSSSQAAFQTRQLDFLGQNSEVITAAAARQIKAGSPDAVVLEYLAAAPTQLYVNSRRPPLDDVRVRKAISRALDRDEFIRVTGGGGWALSGALEGLFTQDEIAQMVRHDPEEARRLVAEAGYPNGLQLEFSYNAARGNTVPELLEAQLKKAGIQLALKPVDNVTDSANRQNNTFTLNWTPTATARGDPANWMYAAFHSDSKQNYWGANDPKLTAMLEAQRVETNPAKRREVLRQAARYINTEMFWGLAIYYPQNYYFWHPHLKTTPPNYWRSGELFPLEVAWLDR